LSQKVLITGADGFIGSHLTESLLEAGYEVKAFVYYNSFNSWGWLGSLHPSRDFNYVKDTAAGFIAIAESPNTIGEEINIASQQEISVGELAQINI